MPFEEKALFICFKPLAGTPPHASLNRNHSLFILACHGSSKSGAFRFSDAEIHHEAADIKLCHPIPLFQ